MNATTKNYDNQERWNEVYGGEFLEKLRDSPESFRVIEAEQPPHKTFVLNQLPDVRDKRILDLGCGQGELSIMLTRLGAEVIGVDLGEKLVELSKEIARINEVECSFRVANITDLPFDDESFDFVVGIGILHHLPVKGLRDAVDEGHRVLKPGGQAFFLEPIENNKAFDFFQNLIPVGTPGDSQYRPSILQRSKWKQFVEEDDDRTLTDEELRKAGQLFSNVRFLYTQFLVRICRIFPSKTLSRMLEKIDILLTGDLSPLRTLSRFACVIYTK